MGEIKDIVDLVKMLKDGAKDRQDMEVVSRLHDLVFALQDRHIEIVERDAKLVSDNEDLRRKLAEANAEEIRIHSAIEFRRGKRTGNQWMPFCPKCHMPAVNSNFAYHNQLACSANCGFKMECPSNPDHIIANAIKQLPQ